MSSLFREGGVKIQSPAMYEREILSGTEIRRRMLNKKPWKKLVPREVVRVIEEIDGVGRLRQISCDD